MLTLEPFSEDQGRSAVHPARGIPAISFLAPCGFTHPLTRTHVRLLGPCFKTGRMGCPQAGCREHAGISPRRRVLPTTIDATASPRAYRQLGLWPPHQSAPPWTEFTALLGAAFPNNPTRRQRLVVATGSGHDGALTLSGAPFQGTWARSAAEDASPDYNSDSEAVRFSAGLIPGSLAVTKGILANRTISTGRPISAPMPCVPIRDAWLGGDAMRDAQAGVPSAGWLWAQLAFKNSMVHGILQFTPRFDNDPSAGSPTETLLRLLLPLNDKVQWNSRDVAGGEPPTSPRS
ncbi:hypothetical protein L1887_47297 [Cichorium endivia]|nr:hypothetical protein L1887_47297 [Cichorium endivia]